MCKENKDNTSVQPNTNHRGNLPPDRAHLDATIYPTMLEEDGDINGEETDFVPKYEKPKKASAVQNVSRTEKKPYFVK